MNVASDLSRTRPTNARSYKARIALCIYRTTLAERALSQLARVTRRSGIRISGPCLAMSPLDVVAPAPPARFADDGDRRLANVG